MLCCTAINCLLFSSEYICSFDMTSVSVNFLTPILHLSLLCNYLSKNSYYVFVVSKVFFCMFLFSSLFLILDPSGLYSGFFYLFLVFRETSAFELHFLNLRILTLPLCILFCMVSFMSHCEFNVFH